MNPHRVRAQPSWYLCHAGVVVLRATAALGGDLKDSQSTLLERSLKVVRPAWLDTVFTLLSTMGLGDSSSASGKVVLKESESWKG